MSTTGNFLADLPLLGLLLTVAFGLTVASGIFLSVHAIIAVGLVFLVLVQTASKASSRYDFMQVEVIVFPDWNCSSKLSWKIFTLALACHRPRVCSSRILVTSLC